MNPLFIALHLATLGLAQSISSSSPTTTTSLSSVSDIATSSSVLSAQTPITAYTSAQPTNTTQDLNPNDTSTETVHSQWSLFEPGASLPEAVFHVPTLEFKDPQGDEFTVSGVRPLVMAYYCGWLVDTLPPEQIDFSKYDIIDYAFVVLDANYNLGFAGMSPDVLRRLVNSAHQHGTKVKVSIGGWTGSGYFSSAVSNVNNRLRLVQNIRELYRSYNLDGIDIDWEYPGRSANGGNQVSPSDSANFLEFLRLLRSALPKGARITAAASPVTFAGPDGRPMKDVSGFAKVLDWVLIMNYDTWGTTSKPGPNAPLHDGCRNSTQPASSAAAAFNAWTGAGFPASQLALGLPSYGYISRSSVSQLRGRDDETTPATEQDMMSAGRSSANVRLKSDESGDQGSISLRSMIQQGALAQKGDEVVGAGGFKTYWDDCSGTPFLRSSSAKQVVPFDNARSIGMKAAFVKKTGMRGVNFWDLHGDMIGYLLANAARKALELGS
ncbi:hypothetical protein V5O48_008954 [Marasmius crinis-equi]|uniref:GH18 domain-containing protein n=1 Tax=Marasmius crinis-equi TaxID=585013 RepID=A0ABR3FCL9_9AGAR